MADKYTTSRKLHVGLTNSEDKLRKLTIPNPIDDDDLTEEQIRAAVGSLINNVGIYDPTTDEKFSTSSITTAYTETTRKIDFDIS